VVEISSKMQLLKKFHFFSRPANLIGGFQRSAYLPATTANSLTSISSSPRQTNGTGPPQPGSRYYPGLRD